MSWIPLLSAMAALLAFIGGLAAYIELRGLPSMERDSSEWQSRPMGRR